MASEEIRQFAREDPETFEEVANMLDNDVCDHLQEVLEEETSQQD